jgi:predicted RNA binding protein YcfA (HicA-like mRNA interferase family)
MPLSGMEMVRLYEKAGWRFVRQTGSHMIMRHPNGRTCPIPRHRELGKGLECDLLKKLKEAG